MKKQTKEQIKQKIINDFCQTLTEAKLNRLDILDVLTNILYSIGASLENTNLSSSEDILKLYAEKPTLGSALMAQALWMKETWTGENKDELSN